MRNLVRVLLLKHLKKGERYVNLFCFDTVLNIVHILYFNETVAILLYIYVQCCKDAVISGFSNLLCRSAE